MAFQFNNPIPRGNLTQSFEQSSLQSPRESGSVFRGWKRMQQTRNRDQQITQALGSLYRQTSRDIRPAQAFSPLFPFAVYQFPNQLRNFIPTNASKRFKVRGGALAPFNSGFAAMAGTDGSVYPIVQTYLSGTIEIPPDDATLISDTWHEVVVPQDGNTYYFWSSLCLNTEDATQGVVFGKLNTSGLSMQSGNIINDPWPTFPNNDPYHTVIAQISSEPGQVYTIEQFVKDNIIFWRNGPDNVGQGMMPMFFRGQYDSSKYYFAGDVVRVGTIGTGNFLSTYMYWPEAVSSSYPIEDGPILNIDPTTHTPDPWLLLSQGAQS